MLPYILCKRILASREVVLTYATLYIVQTDPRKPGGGANVCYLIYCANGSSPAGKLVDVED